MGIVEAQMAVVGGQKDNLVPHPHPSAGAIW